MNYSYFTHFCNFLFHKEAYNFFYHSALHPHVAGLILARGGSRGIPLKNVTLLKNTPLLAWSLSAMRTFRSFDSLWVSTGVNTSVQSGRPCNFYCLPQEKAVDKRAL